MRCGCGSNGSESTEKRGKRCYFDFLLQLVQDIVFCVLFEEHNLQSHQLVGVELSGQKHLSYSLHPVCASLPYCPSPNAFLKPKSLKHHDLLLYAGQLGFQKDIPPIPAKSHSPGRHSVVSPWGKRDDSAPVCHGRGDGMGSSSYAMRTND